MSDPPVARRLSPCLFSLLLLCGGAMAAQTDTLTDSWRWVRFDTDSGLPSNRVLDVVETENGVPWAATSAGVAWYDGMRWHPVGEELGLPGTAPSRILPDQAGGILVRVGDALYHGSSRGFRLLFPRENASFDRILHVAVLPDGRLLMNTRMLGQELWSFDLDEEVLLRFPSPQIGPDDWLRHMWRGRSGRIWLNSRRSLYCLQGGRWSRVLGNEDSRIIVNEVLESGDGTVLAWINTPVEQRGLWEWKIGEKPRLCPDGGPYKPVSMDIGRLGDVVMLHVAGDIRVRRGRTWSNPSGILRMAKRLFCVRFRENDDLWIGTDSGLFLHRRCSERLEHFRHPFPNPHNRILEILLAESGELWTGTSVGIEVRRPDGTSQRITEVAGVRVSVVTGLVQDGNGNVWVSSGSGFTGAFRWDGRTWHRQSGIEDCYIHRIRIDRKGRPWFCVLSDDPSDPEADGPGAYLQQQDGRVALPGAQRLLPRTRVYDFGEGPDGSLWFATISGLRRWSDGRWTVYDTRSGLDEDRVFAMDIDARGRPWFTHGARRIGTLDERGRPDYLEAGSPAPDLQIWDLEFDDRGVLWITSTDGLACLQGGSWVDFDHVSVLSGQFLWPLHIAGTRIYIGTMGDGAIVLDTGERADRPPLVLAGEPIVDSRRIHLRWQAHAPWGEIEPWQIKTRWRLDDGDWSAWDTRRHLELAGLVHGRHTMRFQARGFFGEASDSVTALDFEVPAALHLRPTFFLPVGGLLLSVILLGITHFVRKRRQDRVLTESENRYRSLVESAPVQIHEIDLEGVLIGTNPAGLRMLGARTEQEVSGLRFLDLVAGEDRHRVGACLEGARLGRTTELAFRAFGLEGTRTLASSFIPVRGAGDSIKKLMGVSQDITARKQAEEDRKSLELQLRQSQKMEALGQLAGGVAHDFNNVLTAVLGNVELMQCGMKGAVPPDHPLFEYLVDIERSSRRAASLTQQLLAFSRRQVIRPKEIDLNEILRSMRSMLERLVREDIRMDFVLSDESWSILADQGQIEQVIMNLVVNAHDAMPDGGILRLETSNLVLGKDHARGHSEAHAGPHMLLLVSDTGCGMDAETRSHIFEPFFTTKEVGKGTGLGLATVHGIVKQWKGHITVESREREGTAFRVFLPAFLQTGSLFESTADRPADAPKGGSGTILVCEDDESVRHLTGLVLERHGYRVLPARNGKDALSVAAEFPGSIDLLATDVIMPEMNGCELAENLTREQSDLKVLYLSGYSSNILTRDGVLRGETQVLEKPFSAERLLERVRELLGEGVRKG
ncbi:MAG: ATP-binding protein [Planctomycetota bacterium]